MIGCAYSTWAAFAGYIDDVRLYTSALSAHEVASLYSNPALTQAVGVSNSYLPITSYVKPVLPGANANVVDAKVSQTGQYMVAVTSGAVNNVFYSTDSGATFSSLTIGASPMTACTMSADGSYLTVTNVLGAVYTLNKNSAGYTVAVGSSAGAVNQGSNAIAIGNGAGAVNQSANSIVLNASGATLGTGASGFYVSPIATTAGLPMDLLGYGSDSQVVKTGVTVLPGGNMILGQYVGYGLTNTVYTITIRGPESFGLSPLFDFRNRDNYGIYAELYGVNGQGTMLSFNSRAYDSGNNTVRNVLTLRPEGNVGIGTTNPGAPLHIHSSNTTWTNMITCYSPNVTNNNGNLIILGKAPSDRNNLSVQYVHIADGSTDNFGALNMGGVGQILNWTSAGRVGIGISNPAEKLVVNGNTVSNGSVEVGGTNKLQFADMGLYRRIQSFDGGPLAINELGNNVGIGTTNPGSTLTVNGSLAKSSGTFDIGHPLYPNGSKRLIHSFIEGPRCDLIYRGKTVLVNGVAQVNIDKECTQNLAGAMDEGTFDALCANPQCFLQNISGFDRVRGSILNGVLVITCENSASADSISWMVVAERKDPFIKQWERTDADGFLVTQYNA